MTGFWKDRCVLVTGGCGFIGSHLVEALLSSGAKVQVLGKYNSRSHRGFLEGLEHDALEVHLGDVADPWFVRQLSEDIETIFHLAALIGIPFSYSAPFQYVRTNIEGTLAVLEAARQVGVRRLVHTSTSETYGTAQYVPIDEHHPLVGQSPYSATKIAADKLTESYYFSFDVPVTTIRPFNTYGPRQSMRAVIPTLMAQALFSDEITVGSLEPVRDMTYVADTVSAFLALGAAEGVEGETYNIGSGSGESIKHILELVQKVTGVDKPIRHQFERIRPPKSEVERLICNYDKAMAAIGYAPTVSLEEGLVRTRDYLSEHVPGSDPASYRV